MDAVGWASNTKYKYYLSQTTTGLCNTTPKLWSGAYVLMDNCSIHKGEEIEALITQAGAKLIYLPPYSPDFSPMENCWSKIKSLLRSIGARNYPDLAKAIEQAFEQVSLKDIQNWFTHCCYCTSAG